MISKHIRILLRMLLAVVVAIAFLALLPVYHEPISGCQGSAYLTFDPACSAWLDFGAGFGTVMLLAVLGPGASKPHLWGLAIVMLLAALGGPWAVKSGSHLSFWSDPASLFALWGETGFAMALGGGVAAGIYTLVSKRSKAGKTPV